MQKPVYPSRSELHDFKVKWLAAGHGAGELRRQRKLRHKAKLSPVMFPPIEHTTLEKEVDEPVRSESGDAPAMAADHVEPAFQEVGALPEGDSRDIEAAPGQAGDAVSEEVDGAVPEEVEETEPEQIEEVTHDQIEDEASEEAEDDVSEEVEESVPEQVEDDVSEEVEESIPEQVEEKIEARQAPHPNISEIESWIALEETPGGAIRIIRGPNLDEGYEGYSNSDALLITGYTEDQTSIVSFLLTNEMLWSKHQVDSVCGSSHPEAVRKTLQISGRVKIIITHKQTGWEIVNEKRGRRKRFYVIDPDGNHWEDKNKGEHPWHPDNPENPVRKALKQTK